MPWASIKTLGCGGAMNLDITMALDDSTGHRNLSWVNSMTLNTNMASSVGPDPSLATCCVWCLVHVGPWKKQSYFRMISSLFGLTRGESASGELIACCFAKAFFFIVIPFAP